jgi:hypothetical protein
MELQEIGDWRSIYRVGKVVLFSKEIRRSL